MGRVKKVSKNNIFQSAEEHKGEKSIIVDCSACGLASRPEKKIFSENAITLQSIMMCQQVFSASIIAKIESLGLGYEKMPWSVRGTSRGCRRFACSLFQSWDQVTGNFLCGCEWLGLMCCPKLILLSRGRSSKQTWQQILIIVLLRLPPRSSVCALACWFIDTGRQRSRAPYFEERPTSSPGFGRRSKPVQQRQPGWCPG